MNKLKKITKKITENKKIKISLIIFVILSFSFIGSAAAKYLLYKHELYLYDANDFYFESNLLSDNNNQKSYTYKKGVDNIEISLNNNIDELRYSNVKISYTVTIKDLDGNPVIDQNGNTISEKTGTLEKGVIDSATINFENLKTGTYIVTAISDKPYKKQLNANFNIITSDEQITYQVSDAVDSPVLNLTVSTTDYSGNVVITWPKGIAPDSTDSNFANIDTGYESGEATVTFKANSEYIFHFFKEDASTVFSNSDFSVKEGS